MHCTNVPTYYVNVFNTLHYTTEIKAEITQKEWWIHRYNINYAYCGMFKSIVMLKYISEHVHKEISEIGENTMLHCYEEGRRKEEN